MNPEALEPLGHLLRLAAIYWQSLAGIGLFVATYLAGYAWARYRYGEKLDDMFQAKLGEVAGKDRADKKELIALCKEKDRTIAFLQGLVEHERNDREAAGRVKELSIGRKR